MIKPALSRRVLRGETPDEKQTGGLSRPPRLSIEAGRLTPLSSPLPQTTPAQPSPSPALSQAPPRGEALPPSAGGGSTRAAPDELTAGFFPRVRRGRAAPFGGPASPPPCPSAPPPQGKGVLLHPSRPR